MFQGSKSSKFSIFLMNLTKANFVVNLANVTSETSLSFKNYWRYNEIKMGQAFSYILSLLQLVSSPNFNLHNWPICLLRKAGTGRHAVYYK